MPKIVKTLKGKLEDIDKKLTMYILFNCGMTNKRESWDTTVGDSKVRFTVYEKHAKKVWVREKPDEVAGEWKDQPHYTLSVVLIQDGDQVQLCGISGGSGQEMYFCPDCGPEGELLDVLGTALILMDDMIVV